MHSEDQFSILELHHSPMQTLSFLVVWKQNGVSGRLRPNLLGISYRLLLSQVRRGSISRDWGCRITWLAYLLPLLEASNSWNGEIKCSLWYLRLYLSVVITISILNLLRLTMVPSPTLLHLIIGKISKHATACQAIFHRVRLHEHWYLGCINKVEHVLKHCRWWLSQWEPLSL